MLWRRRARGSLPRERLGGALEPLLPRRLADDDAGGRRQRSNNNNWGMKETGGATSVRNWVAAASLGYPCLLPPTKDARAGGRRKLPSQAPRQARRERRRHLDGRRRSRSLSPAVLHFLPHCRGNQRGRESFWWGPFEHERI